MKPILAIYLVMAILGVGLGIGCYQLNRWWNWKWGYESMVEKKVYSILYKEGLIK